jgi:hypothetical protein
MKVAIFLRGHARTWNLIKDDTIKLFNSIYDNIDWYIAMWDSGTTRDELVFEDFKNQNLIFLSTNIKERAAAERNDIQMKSIFYPHSFKLNNYLKIAYLDSILSRYKRNREVDFNFDYDSVIYIRPDILYKINKKDYGHLRTELYSMEITNLDINYGVTKDEYPMSSDFFMRAGSAASNIISSRLFDVEFEPNGKNLFNSNPHEKLSSFCFRHRLTCVRSGIVEPLIIRPDYLDYLSGKLEYKTDFVDSHRFAYNWEKLVNEKNYVELNRYLDLHKINYRDYPFV